MANGRLIRHLAVEARKLCDEFANMNIRIRSTETRMRAALVGLLSLLMCGAAQAAPSPFYKGKTVHVIVGFTPGGGYDLYARVLARHIGRHLPGEPNVIVENMPGAGSV